MHRERERELDNVKGIWREVEGKKRKRKAERQREKKQEDRQ